MTEEFRIERYRRSDRERVFDLVRVALPVPAPMLIRNWQWMFDANPFNGDAERNRTTNREGLLAFLRETYSAERLQRVVRKWGSSYEETLEQNAPYILLMKNARDEMVAMETALPQRFLVDSREQWVAVEGDWTVHPAYRGRKLAQTLVNRLRNENTLGFAWQNPASRRATKRWRKAIAGRAKTSVSVSGDLPIVPLVKPIDWNAFAKLLADNRLLGLAASVAGAAARGFEWALARPASIENVNLTQIESFDESADQLWQRVHRAQTMLAVRDQRYLNWRFRDRPGSPYIILAAVRDSSLRGYLVFRISDHVGTSCGFLVDTLYDDVEIFSLLIKEVEKILRPAGVKAIVCSVTPASHRSVLLRQGFFPLLHRRRNYLAAWGNSTDPQVQSFFDVSRWFISMGDGNLDMGF
jgi:hypothetical protein